MSQPEPDQGTQAEKSSAGGVNRIAKSRKLARKTPFWRKEAPANLPVETSLSLQTDPVQEGQKAVSVDSNNKPPLSDLLLTESTLKNHSNSAASATGRNPVPLSSDAIISQPDVAERNEACATSDEVPANPASVISAETATSRPARAPKQKQPKAQKQKGKNAADGDVHIEKQDGHHIFRGEELVTGWGDLTQLRPAASST